MSEPTPYNYYPEENQSPYGTPNSSWPNNNSSPSPYTDPTYPNSGSSPYPPQPNTVYAQPPYYPPTAQEMYPPQPQPQQGYMPYGGYRATQSNGPGIAGMVLGIIGVLTFWFPFVGLPVSVIGLVLSFVGMKRTDGKGFAVAGLVLTIIGVILAGCIAAFAISYSFRAGY